MDVDAIYRGSDGEATKELYRALEQLGPRGIVALNVFRAQKCSERAKCYRGGIRGKGSYSSMAYDRKQWSMGNLAMVLSRHAAALGIAWGWKIDPAQSYHCWVLYIDLPTGQVSFHADFATGFKQTTWWDRHRKISRHHLNMTDGVHEDVDLLDVLEHIVDCVMAGMARSGSVYELKLPDEVLQRAFRNTIERLKTHVRVVGDLTQEREEVR